MGIELATNAKINVPFQYTDYKGSNFKVRPLHRVEQALKRLGYNKIQ
jgi:hypothetical protein